MYYFFLYIPFIINEAYKFLESILDFLICLTQGRTSVNIRIRLGISNRELKWLPPCDIFCSNYSSSFCFTSPFYWEWNWENTEKIFIQAPKEKSIAAWEYCNKIILNYISPFLTGWQIWACKLVLGYPSYIAHVTGWGVNN